VLFRPPRGDPLRLWAPIHRRDKGPLARPVMEIVFELMVLVAIRMALIIGREVREFEDLGQSQEEDKVAR